MRTAKIIMVLMLLFSLTVLGLAQQAAAPKPAGERTAAPSIPPSYKNLKYPPLHKINVPEPARFELPNGLVVYLVEDHELPLISVAALIRVGERWEPISKAGLAAITGTVLRTGGSTTRSGDALDQELDRLGAMVETSIGEDSGRATVAVLKEDIDKGISILSDLLQNPAFPEDKIELAKISHRDTIARRNDDPQEIIDREFGRIIYGKDTPYGHQPEYETINALRRADLVAFHKQYFQPESATLGVWGDFNGAEMRAKIEKEFGGWPRGGHAKPAPPAVDPAAKQRAGLYLIKKEDVNQSSVMMGLLGGQRNDPDYYALNLMSRILGGGFSSRLVNNVRTDQGLAYSVYSTWNAGWDRPGLFIASGGTKSETTVKMLESIKREIQTIASAPVSDEELTRAKDFILKGFAFDFDSTAKIVQRLMSYEYYGYPRDYLQKYRENIDKVSKADVQRVAQQYLKSDQLAVLVLGKEKDFDKPLSALGSVMAIDITIPKPKEEALAGATPEAIVKGKKTLSGVRQAMGGAALAAVKDYKTMTTLKLITPQGEVEVKVESVINLSGKSLSKMATPIGEITQGFDGQKAWARTPQGVQEMPGAQKEEAESALFRDTIALLQKLDSGAFTVQALPPAEVDGKPVEGVAVVDSARDRRVKLYIDPQTNLPVKKVYTAALMGAPGEVEEVYSDYRESGGVKLPFKMILTKSGRKIGEASASEIKINPGLEDAAFSKP